MTAPFSQPNQSVLAAIECLQWLAGSQVPISNIEMARQMGVDRNRANRLLKSLVMAGMAQQTPDRKFVVGNGFHALAAQSLRGSGLLVAALPVLEPLRRFKAIAALGVLWHREVVYLYHNWSTAPAWQNVATIPAHPAMSSSIGMILMSHQSEEVIDRLYEDGSVQPFPSLAAMKAELARFRTRGYSRMMHQHDEFFSEAVPIHQNGSPVAGIALSNVPATFPEAERLEALRNAASEIECAMNKLRKPARG